MSTKLGTPEKKLGKTSLRVYVWPSITKRETGPLLWPETACEHVGVQLFPKLMGESDVDLESCWKVFRGMQL